LLLDGAEDACDALQADDPCQLPKACKNPVEIDGMRDAHRRDAVAMVRFLHWLEQEAPHGRLDEVAVADRLEAFRREDASCRGLSFDTIAGFGPNGAIVHYRATPASARRIVPGQLMLIDSGGQYPMGTTDITRTVAIGEVSEPCREHFTRVLMGHIALAMAKFPAGTTGQQLDALARQPLWEAGLDFDHGTGHGVGSYLNVHEGPQRISKGGPAIALKPGMILSNEPGYYRAGEYGIRVENLVVVQEADLADSDRPFYAFETLTLVPMDRRLIQVKRLTPAARTWLNQYHARVLEVIGPRIDDTACREWLTQVCQPL
jgi:Xaa-Pro aminopeptidase